MRQKETRAAAAQIINHQQMPCRRGHSLKQRDNVVLAQMMEEQRADQNVVALRQPLFQCVDLTVRNTGACCPASFAGVLDGTLADIHTV
jgi:hypothetical protein